MFDGNNSLEQLKYPNNLDKKICSYYHKYIKYKNKYLKFKITNKINNR